MKHVYDHALIVYGSSLRQQDLMRWLYRTPEALPSRDYFLEEELEPLEGQSLVWAGSNWIEPYAYGQGSLSTTQNEFGMFTVMRFSTLEYPAINVFWEIGAAFPDLPSLVKVTREACDIVVRRGPRGFEVCTTTKPSSPKKACCGTTTSISATQALLADLRRDRQLGFGFALLGFDVGELTARQ